jgi:hypothetical protein
MTALLGLVTYDTKVKSLDKLYPNKLEVTSRVLKGRNCQGICLLLLLSVPTNRMFFRLNEMAKSNELKKLSAVNTRSFESSVLINFNTTFSPTFLALAKLSVSFPFN